MIMINQLVVILFNGCDWVSTNKDFNQRDWGIPTCGPSRPTGDLFVKKMGKMLPYSRHV